MSYFKVSVLTPIGSLAKDVLATSLTIPTVRGEINVLPKHTHVVSELETGILSVINEDKVEKFIVTSGLCKVNKDQVIILSRVAEKADSIDGERAKKALVKAEEKLSGQSFLQVDEVIKYRRKLVRAKARIQLLTK